MNVALWIVQVSLAVVFLVTGTTKLLTPLADLSAQGRTFVDHMPGALVRFAGLSEIAGALGLVLPSATRIQPKLTPLAAVGLLLVMVLAFGTHLALAEPARTLPNLVLGALAAFVAWGRLRKAPIAPRGDTAT